MSWTGTMQCTVTNQTGGTITNLTVHHQWEQYNDHPEPNPTSTLDNDQSVTFTINVGSGGSDDWSLTFTDASGACWFQNDKQCNVEEGDFESGQPIALNLLPGSQGFSIEMPFSSSCTDNAYDVC